MNGGLRCDVRTDRAAKARLAVTLDKAWAKGLLGLAFAVSLLGWLGLFYAEQYMTAHVLAFIASLSGVVLGWYKGELSKLQPVEEIHAVTDASTVLNRKILGSISDRTTPQDLADIAAKLPGGLFFAARYGMSPAHLRPALSDQPDDTGRIYQVALENALSAGEKEISDAALTVALIRSLPDASSFLAHLQLDETDITAGHRWYVHISEVIHKFSTKRSYGGIGRDLSFGWAPLLNRLGLNITQEIQIGGLLHRPVPSHDAVVDQLMRIISQQGRHNAVLVGEVGVGKTTLVHAMAAKMLEEPGAVPADLRYNQVVSLDPASLIANAKGRGQLEALLIRIFNEAVRVKNIVLFLDNAELFLKDGTGSVDLSNILLPVLEGGALRVVLSLTDQEWMRLGQINPGLAQLMNPVIVQPLGAQETMQVMEDQVLLLEGRFKNIYMYKSLKEAYALAERYVRDQAFPGKAIKLLEAAANFAQHGHFVTAQSVQQAVEQSFGVKVQTARTAEEKQVLLNLEDRIHERMINQSRAVKLVSDALRRARAGVSNENKPIGTFLFLGPTGVGKTELSKALADIYFGGEDRLVRMDLNEFSQASDTNRLLAVGADDPYSLCAQIIKQPFSVVLLDEIEKAHPNVLNVLLQLLDEGILRDADNKPVSFRDAILIATSNAGADKIRARIDQGEALEQFEEQFVNELIDNSTFKPEFLNRFDEIVLFRPLNQEELGQVVDLLIAQLNKRLSSKKIAVSVSDGAKRLLIQAGYDPRLGARPLRRTVQRAVENLLAERMLQDQTSSGQTVQIDEKDLAAYLQQPGESLANKA